MASIWDWVTKLAPAVISGGATIYGASQAASANKDATRTANAATAAGTKAQTDALMRSEQILREQQAAASPGLMHMQQIVGRGDALTPAQIAALDDARRVSIDALQGGSLRGSARATADTVRKVDGDMRTGFMDSNRNRADSAASGLAGQYFGAGNSIVSQNNQAGQAVSQGLINTGNNNANLVTANAGIQGKAIGDIGAIIADQLKTDASNKRNSSYGNVFDEQTKTWRQA